MKTSDLQKVLTLLHDTTGDSLDHLAKRFGARAGKLAKLGDESAHLVEFAASWARLSKSARRTFVEELLKSGAFVIASAVAAKAGVKAAAGSQKKLQKTALAVVDLVDSFATGSVEKGKKGRKKAKKAARKLEKKAKKAS